jgi:dTDP-glucose pyrophosphorylase
LTVALVFWRHNPNATFIEQSSNDGLCGAFNDFNHATFGSAFAVLPDDANLDTVFVQHRSHFIGRQKDIAIAIVTYQEPMSIAMALHAAFDLIEQS